MLPDAHASVTLDERNIKQVPFSFESYRSGRVIFNLSPVTRSTRIYLGFYALKPTLWHSIPPAYNPKLTLVEDESGTIVFQNIGVKNVAFSASVNPGKRHTLTVELPGSQTVSYLGRTLWNPRLRLDVGNHGTGRVTSFDLP